ncbi:MAG TPA: hypothetical protein VHO07_03570 [Streptosporangiaceae bacterium]|jgi:hypothetical protein|nr:hypothetical protein [Streptosporangiaceae bacterium]
MNNSYDPQAGSYGSTPAGTPDPSPSAQARSTQSRSAQTRRKRLFRWGAGITLAGFLAGGGIAWASTAGTSSADAAAATTPANSQGAVLNSALSTAASTSSTVPARRVRSALARLRRVGGIDGEVTFHGKDGYRTLAFERGTIASVSGSDVVIKAPNGTIWTWAIVTDTVVRQGGKKTATSALSPGELVFAGGPVVNGDKDARLIVIRKVSGSASSSGSAGSDSAKTSVS